MKFSSFATLLTAALVSATNNTITFWNQDDLDRVIYFTENPGSENINATSVPGGTNVTVSMPYAWCGNFYSVTGDSPNVAGMLGEVCFDSWGLMTFFDVSAIVNASDVNGVKELYPADSKSPASGCKSFLCDNVYLHPDDVQTKATTEQNFICTLGTANETVVEARDIEETPSFARDFVMGKWSSKRH